MSANTRLKFSFDLNKDFVILNIATLVISVQFNVFSLAKFIIILALFGFKIIMKKKHKIIIFHFQKKEKKKVEKWKIWYYRVRCIYAN